MASLVIEVDLSRLGLGPGPGAVALLPGIGRLQDLLLNFSMSQLERPQEVPLETLILACRRFHGQREDIPEPPTESVDNKDSNRTVSENLQNPPSAVDISSKSSSYDLSDKFARAMSPAPQEPIEQSELVTDDDTKSKSFIWNPDSDDEDEDEDDDGIEANISLESNGSSSSICSSSDSSSNPDTSLVPPSIQEEKLFYCPDKYLSICNHLIRLRNKVTSLRIVGFSDEYSHAFISTIFPKAKSLPPANHSYRVAPCTLWPRLRGQKSWIDAGRGTLILDDHEVIPDPCVFPEGPIQLPPPVVCKSGIRPLPWCREPTQRPRNSTTSSGSSWPSQRISESNEEANTSKISRSSDERSRMHKLLDKYKEKSRRRPRPISAP